MLCLHASCWISKRPPSRLLSIYPISTLNTRLVLSVEVFEESKLVISHSCLAQFVDTGLILFFSKLYRVDVALGFACKMVGFRGVFASFQGTSPFFESVEWFAVLGLHSKRGFGEKSASFRSNFVNGTGLVHQKGARIMHDVLVIFCLVCFPHAAQRFKKGFCFGMYFWVALGCAADFTRSQKIIKSAADTAFIA
jgi:hypothetical protein